MIQTLNMLIHAESKVGKTTLAATAPWPLLILDAEGGSKFLPMRKVAWDPRQGPPPAYDGTWDACIVVVQNFEVVEKTYQWMQAGQHQFRSVVIDSITEVQRRCKSNLVGTAQMQIQNWGQLLTLMDEKIRGFRDLTEHPINPVQCVVFIAETRMIDGKWRPYMQGQIVTSLPYWMDIVGYLYVDNELDEHGQPTREVRKLLIKQHPEYEAGERVQGKLGHLVENPHISQMINTVYQDTQVAQQPEPDQPPPPMATA